MKKSLLLFASAIVLLAGCAKEKFADLKGGELTSVTFSAQMDNGVATRAVADGDGAAANVNRCIMEIYYGGELFTRMYAKVIDKTASFTTQLVSNRTYTVAFWADNVDNVEGEDIATDKYYTTANGLGAVALKGTYAGNLDARDAFAFCGDYTIAQGGSAFSAKLKRPFAQINVITTDVETVKKVASLKPEKVNVTVKNAVTKYNVLDSTAVAGETADLNYEATLYNWNDTKSECTLSMDYIFAENEKAVVDIDWKATKANNADVAHAFASVPYQRNYRTNIKGALLTTTGKWDVTVDPNWNTDATGEFDVIVLVANTISEAQDLINANAGSQSVSKTVEIQVKEQIAAVKELYIPDNTTTPSWVFKIEDMTDAGKIVVKDQTPADNTKNYKMSAEVALPSGVSASQTTFNTPNAHGVVSGTFGRIDATTSATTLEIKADATVAKLYVYKGNVALYGTVGSINRGANNTETVIVNIYDGAVWTNWATEKVSTGIKPVVNLGTYEFDPTGYNVAGSAVIANETTPATWTVTVLNEWKYFAANEFSNISGTTITIMNAEELALFGNNVNKGTTYAGYTVKLGCDIDLAAHNWTPMASSTNPSFQGTFDGQNRTISNVKISGSAECLCFFGASYHPTIKNVIFDNATISGGDNACVVVNFGALVQNVTVKNSTITGKERVGAIAGGGYVSCKNCTVENCTITGTEQVAAVSGYMCGIEGSGNTVKNCTITATVNRAGGVFGKIEANDNGTTAGYVWSNNKVENTKITAPEWVGGVASQIMGKNGEYQIKANSIDATLTQTSNTVAASHLCPVAALRNADINVDFASKLEANITGNTWTKSTFDANSYVYTCEGCTITFDDQTIWNGEPTNIWTNYAAKSFSSINETDSIINITSAAELALVAKTLNSGKAPARSDCSSYYYAGWKINLANDIDLAGHDWVPIGNDSYLFYGAFDGKGYTISNMTISTEFTYKWNGLFGAVQSTDSFDGAYFGNVVFDKANVKSTYYSTEPDSRVGVFVGGFNRPIDKVTVKNSTVESIKYAAAIAGINYCQVTDCTVENTVINGLRVGGIVGTFYGASITNCVLKGTTTLTRSVVEDSEVGGFTSRTLEDGGSPTHTISGNTIYNTVKINGVAFNSTMPEEGSASPYVGSCVGRDYNNTTTCENNKIGFSE